MLRHVTLHGPLAARFSPETIVLDADDFPELVSGLNSAFPGFRRALVEQEQIAVGLRGADGVSFLTEEQFGWRFGAKDQILISTSQRGSGTEAAAWVATEVVGSSWAASSGWTAFAYAAVYVATTIAMAYALSAVAQSLAEKPEGGASAREEQSYLLDGAVNLEGQGHPIPLVYGLYRCGSVVISSDVIAEKNAIAISDSYTGNVGVAVTGNIFENDIDGVTMTLISFTVNGVSYAPGSTATVSDYSVTIDAAGNFSVTSASTRTIEVSCIASSPTTLKTESVLTVTVVDPSWGHESTGGDGTGGSGG